MTNELTPFVAGCAVGMALGLLIDRFVRQVALSLLMHGWNVVFNKDRP